MTESVQNLVLDSWPIVEWLRKKEPVTRKMNALYEEAEARRIGFLISRINLGEVTYIGRKEMHLSDSEVLALRQMFLALPIEVVSATDDRVDAAADLKSRYRISYADAFAAALSMERNAPLVTGDREFRALELDGLIQLHWIGN